MNKTTITYEEMYKTLEKDSLDITYSSLEVVKNPVILKDKINEKYKFIKKNLVFKFFSFLFYLFSFIVLYPILSVVYLPKIKGKENLKNIKNAIFIANHTFVIDSALISTHVLKFRRPYFLVDKQSFQIPLVKTILKLFKAIPVPTNLKTYKNFITEIDNNLQNNNSLFVFAEGSMWPYYCNIRPFNLGAFRFSVKNNLPIIPIVVSFRKPNKFYKFFRRKRPLININILKPEFPNLKNINKQEQERLNVVVNTKMKETFKKENSYVFINEKALKKEKRKNKTK